MDSMASYLPGDVVRTSYGIGVLVAVPLADSHSEDPSFSLSYQVSLWRLPGKSVGSSSTAYLNKDSMIGNLPAAPGMITFLLQGEQKLKVMVHAFHESSAKFLVSLVNENENESFTPTQLIEVNPEELEKASSAKFYPLLHELMKQGDLAAQATSRLLHDKKVVQVVQKSKELIVSSTDSANNKSQDVLSKENIEKLTNTVKDAIPKEEDMKDVVNMLRDEELTVLLQKGQQRLKELMTTDISKATKDALRKAGFEIADSDDSGSFSDSIAKSRLAALTALEELLNDADINKEDIQALQGEIERNFTTMFDSLSTAAKSDRTLSGIFETITGKTSEWQAATGRLLSTKSGSLFMEGASRLQARANNLFSKGQLDWAGEVGSKLTKSFTEGDAALARLKSLELGDAVRSRLVSAIEVRSGSHGGLDSIIAGALSTVSNDGVNSGQMKSMLTSLQATATSTRKEAHETLISVLSRRNEYQDVALIRIELVLCDLETHLEHDLSPEDIASIARGEGGTASIFEPIAKRASKEIEKQLNYAESNVTDPHVIAGLHHVRKLISGDLTVNGLMDEVVNILNDENVVAAGETFVKQGEFVLDAIEGISGNKMVQDALQIAEKAGITKDTVMQHMESIDVDQLLDAAGNVVTDEKARQELLSSATDTALDFMLRILPSMPVPPFEGVKDGLVYNLSNLSMAGFKVKKEDIEVSIAGMKATKKVCFPDRLDVQIRTGGAIEMDVIPTIDMAHPNCNMNVVDPIWGILDAPIAAKATELLIIDVQRISAILDDAIWEFEQTYMPYLKGSGRANIRLSDGSIRLQFELRKQKKKYSSGETVSSRADVQWEPVLCLHDRSCTIDQVELTFQGEGRLTWVANKLASWLRGRLRDYIVRTIVNILTNRSGIVLEKLNVNLAPYWGLIMRTAQLDLDSLVEADEQVIIAALPNDDEDLIELVWRECLPLGMNLLLNDDSGLLKVVDFPRGSQARKMCEGKDIDPNVFNGATIVSVNGTKYEIQEELYEALKDPSRPKSIRFRLARNDAAEQMKQFALRSKSTQEEIIDPVRAFDVRDVTFQDSREIGIEFASSPDNFSLVLRSFVSGPGGTVLEAEKAGNLHPGDLLCKINGELVLGENGKGKQRALELLERFGTQRPLTITFVKPYMYQEVFDKAIDVGISEVGGPEEFLLDEEKNSDTGTKRIRLKGFLEVNGTVETGGILIGDQLVFVNGIPVGAGCKLTGENTYPELGDIYKILKNEYMYPIALTFARPRQKERQWVASLHGVHDDGRFDVENADTICVTANSFNQLGCVFESRKSSREIVLTDLFAVCGPFQTAMSKHKDINGKVHLSIEAVNGQFVPSYATTDIVMNAMKRSWSNDGKIAINFCDDQSKDYVHNLE